jgi:multisubunit Na+/H+ antiporter MnhB subunit
MAELVFDLLLGLGLLVVAWSALRSRELQAAIVLFIVFGLLMALAWTRLEAPDVALAEAAIGAGVTGALLLEALARLRPDRNGWRGRETAEAAPSAFPRGLSAAAALAAGAAAVAIGAAVVALPTDAVGLRPVVDGSIEASGVDHPVTAVLLNFRAYDTWLEIAVLLAAVAGILAVLRAHEPEAPTRGRPGELLGIFTRSVVPAMVLVALYLLWRGTSGPGGAFQAGAVLAAAGILLYATRVAPRAATLAWRWRAALVAGVAAFAALAAGSLLAGEALLTYPRGGAGTLILAVEAAVMLAVAGTLAAVLAAVAAAVRGRSSR